MDDETLFPISEIQQPPCDDVAPAKAAPRVQYAVRDQVEMITSDLDSLIAADHQVRIAWAFVEQQDFSALYDLIRGAGRSGGPPACGSAYPHGAVAERDA